MRMIANEPARRKRAEERERKVAIVEEHPAHILAFGEAFDPVLSEPVHPMKQMLSRSQRMMAEAARTGAAIDRGTNA